MNKNNGHNLPNTVANLIGHLHDNRSSQRLLVLSTPIGNLGDLSIRQIQALREAHAILCEDTRRTSTLLTVLGIQKPLIRLDAHSERSKIDEITERLKNGENLVLVTDAGTPGVSDPGSVLVKSAWDAGVAVSPVPGVSAVTTLLSVAGLNETPFLFRGFFPKKSGEIQSELALLTACELSQSFVYFESPERILSSIERISEWTEKELGTGYSVFLFLGKELTKIHEQFYRGTSVQVLNQLRAPEQNLRGEWSFLIHLEKKDQDSTRMLLSSQASEILDSFLEQGFPPSEASKWVSQIFEVPRKLVYSEAVKRRSPPE